MDSRTGEVVAWGLFVVASIMAVFVPGFFSVYMGSVAILGLNASIAGLQSKNQGKGFCKGFTSYINEEWAQDVAIDMFLALATFGISKGVALFKASRRAKLANAASKEVKHLDNGGKQLLLNAPNPSQLADHHIIPKFRGKSSQYADFISARGINVDDYTVTLYHGGKNSHHLKFIHGQGYNKQWMNWIDNNLNATAFDIYQFAGKMMDDYGLSGLRIHPYGL